MNVNSQRMLDKFVGSFLCFLASLFPQRVHDTKPNARQQILVILLSEMGSLVLSAPMFMRIKEKYPDAGVHALVFERNTEVISLLGLVPADNIYTIRDKNISTMVIDSLFALKAIRKKKIDTVIDCELFARISSIYSFLSNAGTRVGFHRHKMEGLYRGDFINRPVMYNPYLHISEQFINLVEAIDGSGLPVVKRRVYDLPAGQALYRLDMQDKKIIQDRLATDYPKIDPTRLVLLYPGGGLLPIRAWPIENYGRVAEVLNDDGFFVGIIGLAADHLFAEKICYSCRPNMCIDLTGYTKNLRALLGLFQFARLLITNDGGPGHFATMTPIRSIVLYGPETPILYGPLSERTHVFYNRLSCSPCLTAYNHRATPCDGNNVCLKSISADEVLKKAHEFLEIDNR